MSEAGAAASAAASEGSGTAMTDCYDIAGYRVHVGSASADALDGIRIVLRGFGPIPPAADLPRYLLVDSPTAGWQIHRDDEVIHPGGEYVTALGALEWRLMTTALEKRTDVLHVHGAALCLPTQRAAIVLSGASGSGKTTLTMALMLRGFVPFGDDTTLLDPETLEVQPVHRAFHVTPDVWALLESLGSPLTWDPAPLNYFAPPQWAERPVPVRWVLFPEYRPGQSPELVKLSAADAATAILAESNSLPYAPRVALPAVTRLVRQAGVYRFKTGDLAASVAMVQRLVAEAVA